LNGGKPPSKVEAKLTKEPVFRDKEGNIDKNTSREHQIASHTYTVNPGPSTCNFVFHATNLARAQLDRVKKKGKLTTLTRKRK
jgi:hypothetical protein